MSSFTPDTDNQMFQLAVRFAGFTNRNIFITGNAGTGKTSFLKYIREHCPKQLAIVAPTGVAAINAGGATIHSFFQLPISPFIPEEAKHFSAVKNDEELNRHSLISRMRMTNEKRKVIRELELLVIDEISMVRADTLDAIDTVLRHFRHQQLLPFGGVQVLFIGDLFQLPPVVPAEEWRLLEDYYKSPFFFDSMVLKNDPSLCIEFEKIYRQQDIHFISLLNEVRNAGLTDEGYRLLESRYDPGFITKKEDGYIMLTTHNAKAEQINNEELQKLNGKEKRYQAIIDGDFSEKSFPADEILQLKPGAQVMFLRNDSAEKGKRFFNGKIGTVTSLEEDKVFVQCNEDPAIIEVQREEWKNIRYAIDKNTRRLEEEVLGSFRQFPLRLAWAITIHKSQGLTFEKAIIDAGAAFAPGQVYVALSRCTCLDGLILKSRINRNGLYVDPHIRQFNHNKPTAEKLQSECDASGKIARETLLLSQFDFAIIDQLAKELKEYILEHKKSFNDDATAWASTLQEMTDSIQQTAKKFQAWLQTAFVNDAIHSEKILSKTQKGSAHFNTEIEKITEHLQKNEAITDSRLLAKEFNDTARELFTGLQFKKYLLVFFNEKTELEKWFIYKSKFKAPASGINAYAGTTEQKTESPHPVLHRQLRKLRDEICSKKNLPIYLVAGSNTLNELATFLPQDLNELKKISGFGDVKVNQYGQQFLDIILAYCQENSLGSLINDKKPKREQKKATEKTTKPDTKAESLKLHLNGLKPEDIAKERSLTIDTIWGHLAWHIKTGEIEISEVMSTDKVEQIKAHLSSFKKGDSILSIKEKLGTGISFGEIRMVIALTEKNQ